MKRPALLVLCLIALSGQAPDASQPRCRILLTNDDGVKAPGLLAAYKQLSTLCETVISAPAADQSGASHAILNTRGGIAVRKVELENGIVAHAVEGSPAEAAVVGLYAFGGPRSFHLVVSGVNRGENLGLGNLYSGTVNAAMEGALRGTPSIAVSQARAYGMDYSDSAAFTRSIAALAMKRGLGADVVLNVNIPHGAIKGVKVVQSGHLSTQFNGFDVVSTDPTTTVYTPRITLRKEARERGDVQEYLAGYITITPLALDRTARAGFPKVRRVTEGLRAP